MGNERLRAQLIRSGLSPAQLAERAAVDPKTVERWITAARVPHPRHRAAVSKALAMPEGQLWPELLNTRRAHRASQSEVLTVYPTRAAVPVDVWLRLVDDATERVEILAYAALFLHDGHPDLPQKLGRRAGDGLQVRLLYGDPDSSTVAWRGEEEGIGANLAARIRLSLTYMSPICDHANVEIRQHESILYNSLYRFDDELLVNTHVMGSPAPHNPVIHLRRIEGGTLFEHYTKSFERVWLDARPLVPTA